MEVLALLRSTKRRRRIPLSSLIIQEVGSSQEGSTGSDLQRAAEEAEAPKENELPSPASRAAATIDLDILHNSMEDIVANLITSTLDANCSR